MSEPLKDTNTSEVTKCVPEQEQSAGPSVKLPPSRRVYSKRRFPTCNSSTEDTIMQEQSRSNEDELLQYEHQKPTNPPNPLHASHQEPTEKATLAAIVQIENVKKDTFARTEVEDMEKVFEGDEAWKAKEAEIFSSHVRRDVIEIDDSSDSSDSESSSTVSHDNDDSNDGSVSDKSELNETKTYGPRTKGELTIDDLPPIEDLQISVDENQCKPIGSVSQIVNKMVVIQSLPHTPPLNIDTVLFVDRGQRAIGKIFDVFGPVEEPFYCIRFNSAKHVADKKITKEQMVYCAPETEYTSYIHTAELMQNKGSDASWMDNNEPPISCLDFSDDEDEARYKRSVKNRNAGSKKNVRVDDEFVKKMNQRNLELTAKRKKEDEAKQKRGSSSRRPIANASSHNGNTIGLTVHSQPFVPVSESYRVKTRTFTNSEQPSRPAQYYNLVTTATAAASTQPHLLKFDAPIRSGNFMYSGYSGPPPPPPPTTAYAFSPQPQYSYVCAPRPVSGAQPPQNYLTMYTHASIPSQAVMGPPFSNFTSPALTTIPSYPTQPPLPPSRLSTTAILPPMPPTFTSYAPLRAAPLPSTVPPQATTYFHCTDGPHQTAPGLIHMNVNSAFHPQFVLPPPSIPSQQSQHHQRGDAAMAACPERRLQQHPTTNSFYPTPRYKS